MLKGQCDQGQVHHLVQGRALEGQYSRQSGAKEKTRKLTEISFFPWTGPPPDNLLHTCESIQILLLEVWQHRTTFSEDLIEPGGKCFVRTGVLSEGTDICLEDLTDDSLSAVSSLVSSKWTARCDLDQRSKTATPTNDSERTLVDKVGSQKLQYARRNRLSACSRNEKRV